MKSIRIAQANVARETARLAGTLERMNATVISALVEINATAIRVNQTIGKRLDSFHLNLVSLMGATIIYCECEDDSDLRVFVSTAR
jgi:fumarate hydratase class II